MYSPGDSLGFSLAKRENRCYIIKWTLMKGDMSNEGKVVCETYLRKVQSDQKKRFRQNHLRESETQAETGLSVHFHIEHFDN